jgi:hypothetical protein
MKGRFFLYGIIAVVFAVGAVVALNVPRPGSGWLFIACLVVCLGSAYFAIQALRKSSSA